MRYALRALRFPRHSLYPPFLWRVSDGGSSALHAFRHVYPVGPEDRTGVNPVKFTTVTACQVKFMSMTAERI